MTVRQLSTQRQPIKNIIQTTFILYEFHSINIFINGQLNKHVQRRYGLMFMAYISQVCMWDDILS